MNNYKLKVNSPCKDCKNRFLGCHSKCEGYKIYKEELTSLQEDLDKQNSEIYLYKIGRSKA